MKYTLYRLEREINSLDTGRMSVRVKGTFLSDEVASLLEQRPLVTHLKKQLE